MIMMLPAQDRYIKNKKASLSEFRLKEADFSQKHIIMICLFKVIISGGFTMSTASSEKVGL